MRFLFKTVVIISALSTFTLPQDIKVIEATNDYLKLSINFGSTYSVADTLVGNVQYKYIRTTEVLTNEEGTPYLPGFTFQLGIPQDAVPHLEFTEKERTTENKINLIPYSLNRDNRKKEAIEYSTTYDNNNLYPLKSVELQDDFILRFSRILPVTVSPYQYNPVTRELVYNKSIDIKISFTGGTGLVSPVNDKFCEDYLKHNTVNYSQAVNWIGRKIQSSKPQEEYWYNPDRDYYKIFLSKKGLYRVTYQDMVNAGAQLNGISINNLQLYNEGQPVPIDVVDDGDLLFNNSDYIQFVGFPPKPNGSDYLNIYTKTNIYWLTFQNDTSPVRYNILNGYPDNWVRTIQATTETIHYEVDSLYERLGYAPQGDKDHWFWGISSGIDGYASKVFSAPFNTFEKWNPDSLRFTIRVGMQGITNGPINPDHIVRIQLTSQIVDTIKWDGQTTAVFEKSLVPGQDVNIFAVNNLQVVANGKVPVNPQDPYSKPVDEIRVNWFEFDYSRTHAAYSDNFRFYGSDTGAVTYSVYRWNAADMKIYIPSKGGLILNPRILNNQYNEVLFRDTADSKTEYFCAGSNYFLVPEAIIKDVPSDLRNSGNAADYIIITHPDFEEAAQRLAAFRSANLAGFTSPRIKVVDINSIYDEFSAGLLTPYAIRDFIKYTFENWTAPAPRYVVLLGDMSYDYRGLSPASRKSFIPSIPFQQSIYGQAVADNNFVTVAGDDLIPDLAIGRLSCETSAEADILVDKIISYPSDKGKGWKENTLLIGGGQSFSDENLFGFNNHSVYLENNYIKSEGLTTTKVFRYPTTEAHMPFKGDGPEIRKAFNQGCVMANFYGHGGGYQWDLIFLNDDIYLLENGGRMPFISSVTCYTAHFDNQDVFGEQFNKVPGKGSIGFWGSTGLTFWDPAVAINRRLYNQIFKNSVNVVGDAILYAKTESASNYYLIVEHIVLLSLLGDPALELALPKYPDLASDPSLITVNPYSPVAEDTMLINMRITNYGRVFPDDTLQVSFSVDHGDSVEFIESKYLDSFGQQDSVIFRYAPLNGGNYTFHFTLNEDQRVFEEDYSDNEVSVSVYVYSIKEPNIIKPNNGMVIKKEEVEFIIADVGYYIGKDLVYHLQADTSAGFSSPIINDSLIRPAEGLIAYKSNLPEGKYFWRTRLKNEDNFSSWTAPRTFMISDSTQLVYSVSENQLKVLQQENTFYSDSLAALVINTKFLPPKPSSSKYTGTLSFIKPADILSVTASATDGKYIYYANMAYYANPSKIHKVGTGKMGSVKGQDYGEIPGVAVNIWHTMFYHDNFIYVATGDCYRLLKINPETGETTSVNIPSGMLNETARVRNGAFYLASDGKYVYNLAYLDSLGNFKYTLRVLDPANDWMQVRDDVRITGTSYGNFVSFFAADGYIFPYENADQGLMRRINTETGIFEEEWLTAVPFRSYYTWNFDWINNVIYASLNTRTAGVFYQFSGRYKNSSGHITTNEVGPASSWESLSYDIEKTDNLSGFNVMIEGKKSNSTSWDTLYTNASALTSLAGLNAEQYPYIRACITLTDNSLSELYPVRMKDLLIKYKSLPEIFASSVTLSPDSLLQGFPITFKAKTLNRGYTGADSLTLSFILNEEDTALYKTSFSLPADSSKEFEYQLSTARLSPASLHNVKYIIGNNKPEFFNFNNSLEKSFYVSRDSINPEFKLTIDGREIINGDIVSAKPEIIITLKDNGPLPLMLEDFTMVYNNNPIKFDTANIEFIYTPYPNSEATIKWKPDLKDGRHSLEILAKDGSGNFFDSTSAKVMFYVFNQFDILYVYNYPNPFIHDTHFTFELRGDDKKLEEFRIRIYTIAGRLIKEIEADPFSLRAGFNKLYWDGRDEDGDEVGNGVYLYKIITKNDGITKTVIQKLAKVK